MSGQQDQLMALLEFDPAAIVFQVGLDMELLERLDVFASSLAHYLRMQKENCKAIKGQAGEEEGGSGVARMPIEGEDDADKEKNPPTNATKAAAAPTNTPANPRANYVLANQPNNLQASAFNAGMMTAWGMMNANGCSTSRFSTTTTVRRLLPPASE